eukprot:gene34572-39086_t
MRVGFNPPQAQNYEGPSAASHASVDAAGQGGFAPRGPPEDLGTADKLRLLGFAAESGKSASEIVRCALDEAMRGRVAGNKRRHDIAELRRSTNLMLATFAG